MTQQPQPTHICSNANCKATHWHVERNEHNPTLWYLRGRGVFTMAADAPFCPICGEPLVALALLEVAEEENAIQLAAD